MAYHDTVATNGRPKSLSTGSERKTSSEKSCMFLHTGILFIFFLYLFFLFLCFTHSVVFLNSNIGDRRSADSQTHSAHENPSFGICTLCCRDATDPSDSTLHSGPRQPVCLPHPAPSDCSCGTVLAMVRHRAEPTCHEERPKTLVHLHR